MSKTSAFILDEVLGEFSMHGYAIDEAHAMLVYGHVVASKPVDVIEFGLGPTGSLNSVVRAALSYNANPNATYTVVDNWLDWEYRRPALADKVAEAGCIVVECSSQADHIRKIPDNSYDLTISDADHGMEPQLLFEFLRITRPGGTIFVHDANNHVWEDALRRAWTLAAAHDSPWKYHQVFTKNSLPNERNERGTLMIFK